MHDWTLVSILVDWTKGTVTIIFRNYESKEVTLVAKGFSDLRIPKREEWGESVSVNGVSGPMLTENGNCCVELEIQSGDKIYLEAEAINMPYH